MTINNYRILLAAVSGTFLVSLIFGFLFLYAQVESANGARRALAEAEKAVSECNKNTEPLDEKINETVNEPADDKEQVREVNVMLPDAAVKKAVEYINKNMLDGDIKATSKEIKDANGLYQFQLTVEGKDYGAYVTKDGKFLFADGIPQAIKLDEPVADAGSDIKVSKTAKPDVKIFVMSYCPYGLQAQKMYLPVYDLLKNKATMGIYFVNYAMHGYKEIDENLRQYCIQKEQTAKYTDYLRCFTGLAPEKDGSSKDSTSPDFMDCLINTGVDMTSLGTCMKAADSKFGVSANYDDRSKWISGAYPRFLVHDDLNNQYSVQGSPTIIVNGVDVSGQLSSRTPENLKKLICSAFANQPAECKTVLSNDQPSSGFGAGKAAATAAGGCGG